MENLARMPEGAKRAEFSAAHYEERIREFAEELDRTMIAVIATAAAARHGGKHMSAIRLERARQYINGALSYLR